MSHRSSSSPTWALLPRSGSMVGTRCSDSRPGRSKITESQDAAATCVGVLLEAAAAEVGAGVLGGSCIARLDRVRRRAAARSGPCRPAGGRGPSRGGCRSTGRSISCSLASSQSRPSRSRYWSSSLSLATQSSSRGAQHRVALEPVEHRLPAAPARRGSAASASEPSRSSTYFLARSRYSIWSWTAVSLRPSVERDLVLAASGRARPRAAPTTGAVDGEVAGRGSGPRSSRAPARWCRP